MSTESATIHQIFFDDAHDMARVDDDSVRLVITSPPYPMIEMWDALFCAADDVISDALKRSDSELAFERMHQYLDGVWDEAGRVLAPGGIACINIGDATRTVDGHFRVFANHARVINKFQDMGFIQLPTILWRKSTNAPNKFMGSGMLPPGAYVTLEHEYILIFRKGHKRTFSDDAQKQLRRKSAYFWEERNLWFSDVWTGLPGVVQDLKNFRSRQRSAAFPLELPYRLINMFSIFGDTVLDPFVGSGTTLIAAMCAGRNGLGYEIDEAFSQVFLERIASAPLTGQRLVQDRLDAHRQFASSRMASKADLKYQNINHRFPVMTRQEIELCLRHIASIQFLSGQRFKVDYSDSDEPGADMEATPVSEATAIEPVVRSLRGRQLKLF